MERPLTPYAQFRAFLTKRRATLARLRRVNEALSRSDEINAANGSPSAGYCLLLLGARRRPVPNGQGRRAPRWCCSIRPAGAARRGGKGPELSAGRLAARRSDVTGSVPEG